MRQRLGVATAQLNQNKSEIQSVTPGRGFFDSKAKTQDRQLESVVWELVTRSDSGFDAKRVMGESEKC